MDSSDQRTDDLAGAILDGEAIDRTALEPPHVGSGPMGAAKPAEGSGDRGRVSSAGALVAER